jgi:CheY-like chemotaxis protein
VRILVIQLPGSNCYAVGEVPRILLVADDTELRETLATALTREGLSVDHAEDGNQALALLEAGLRPDAIVLNIMMPNMSGWQFRAKQLATANLASIPTVLIAATGNLTHAAIDADGVLPKPVTPDQLLAALRRHLPVESGALEDEAKTNPKLRALAPEDEAEDASWRIVPATRGETLRGQEDLGSRWVAISLGEGKEIGTVIVEDSTGWRQAFECYEDALDLCHRLRGGRRVLAG